MKKYQEVLITLAGFHKTDVLHEWYKSGNGGESIMSHDAEAYFNSLDWLENSILPSVRSGYKVWKETYDAESGQYVFHRPNGFITIGYGRNKVESMNSALDNLVSRVTAG